MIDPIYIDLPVTVALYDILMYKVFKFNVPNVNDSVLVPLVKFELLEFILAPEPLLREPDVYELFKVNQLVPSPI